MTAVAGPAGYGLADVAAVLPHRHPMLLVDRVVELEPGASVLATKAVTATEPWFRGADPADPATEYPPVLVIESGGARRPRCWRPGPVAAVRSGRPGRPLRRDVRAALGRPVRPGDVLEHRARIVRDLGDTWIFEGETRVGDTVVLEVGSAMTALRPAAVLREAAP